MDSNLATDEANYYRLRKMPPKSSNKVFQHMHRTLSDNLSHLSPPALAMTVICAAPPLLSPEC
jgi:hypothetical protein